VFYANNFIKIRNAAETLTPRLECIFYNAVLAFTLQYPLLLAPLKKTDDEETIVIKLKLVSSYLDIVIARRIWNFCFLQIKIPHFCKNFSPGTSGEFLSAI